MQLFMMLQSIHFITITFRLLLLSSWLMASACHVINNPFVHARFSKMQRVNYIYLVSSKSQVTMKGLNESFSFSHPISRIFIIIITLAGLIRVAEGRKSTTKTTVTCPGECVKDAAFCKGQGGKVLGFCKTGGDEACCDLTAKYTGGCGTMMNATSSGNVVIFQNPHYPNPQKGNLACDFFYFIQGVEFDGILIEFEDVNTEGVGFGQHSPCDSDMIFIKGFKYWQPPPRCGDLRGYAVLIDKGPHTKGLKYLQLLAVMSSENYHWKIKITLIGDHKADKVKDHSLHVVPTSDDTKTRKHVSNNHKRPSKYRRSLLDEDETPIPLEPFIVNGDDTNITEVPWQASLRLFYPPGYIKRVRHNIAKVVKTSMNRAGPGCASEGRHFCGGSIISNRHILTAAHCFEPMSKLFGWLQLDTFRVMLGETDVCQDDFEKYGRTPQNLTAEKVIFHYSYDSTGHILNDVVVVKLKEKIEFNEHIKPVNLAKRGMSPYEGLTAQASGWGQTNLTSKKKAPFILQLLDNIQIENKTTCDHHLLRGYGGGKKQYVTIFPKYGGVFDSVFCTKATNDTKAKGMGKGDSGGPLVFMDKRTTPATPFQIGIVSYGLPALETKEVHGNTFIDYYQDVGYYRDWIELAMKA